MWALDLGVSMVCVFESPLKGIPSLGFQPPICHKQKLSLGSFSGVLPTVPGTVLTVTPRTGHSGEAVVVVGPVREFDSQKMSKTFLPRIQNSGFWAHVVHGPQDPKGPT
jgi:hypothetical protein